MNRPALAVGEEAAVHKTTLIVIVSLALVTFIGILSETALNIAYALLIDELGVSAAVIQWLTTGYLLTLSTLIPLSPLLVKKVRTKRLFQAAIFLFAFGTMLCGFATTFWLLLAGRIIQAVGTSISLPLLMNIILAQIPLSHRGRVMGLAGLVASFAPALGPTFGGVMIEWLNWHWIFFSVLPLLALSFLCGSRYIKDIRSEESISIDALSIFLSTLAFVGLVYGVSISAELGWKDAAVLSCLVSGALSLAAFVVRQLRLDKPLIHVRVFSHAMFSIGAAIVMISMMTVLAAGFVLPLYVQKALGFSSIAAALVMLPGAMINGIMSPFTGRFYDKHGARLLLLTGFFLLSLTLAVFSFTQANLNETTVVYALFMFGASMLLMPAQTNGLNQLPPKYNADGVAIMATLQQVAGALGTALASSLLTMNSANFLTLYRDVTPALQAQAIAFGTQQNFRFFLLLGIVGFALSLWTRKKRTV
ncbi:DHA2 family efflux MFS transporter permease subunit [Azotosporobacter soli]|uniref:DHA2 family efflux MFS transporter permease subunit n=1 Tax=Azotosporobacter soli TaxID=3055040 RepID=UPI0031FE5CC2